MNPITTLPALSIEIGGEPLPDPALSSLSAVRVHQCLSRPSMCELSFSDPDPTLAKSAGTRVGSQLQVGIGSGGAPLFTGTVTAVEQNFEVDGGHIVRFRGYDALHALRMRRPLRVHVQVSAADLAREFAGELGLEVEAAEPGPIWDRILQTRQSDWELLLDVAERSGLHFLLVAGTLRLMTLEGLGDEIPLVLGDTLLEAKLEANVETACKKVSALGWDPLLAETRRARADSPRTGGKKPATQRIRETADAERSMVGVLARDTRQAASLAQSALDYLAAGETVLRGVAEGNNELRPGTRVSASGIGESFSGTYVLTEVEHLVDSAAGYVSRISTAPLPPREQIHHAMMVLGNVCAVADPEGLGRVKVEFPAFGNLESEWLCVVIAGAGAGKGLFALPDLGDRVLVLCPRGDLAHGLVLGGLYGAAGAPGGSVTEEGVHRYTLTTPGGQRVFLDDRSRTVTLENSGGCMLEMGPEGVILRSTVPLTLEAPGSPIRVRGLTIDFENAQDTELEDHLREREEIRKREEMLREDRTKEREAREEDEG